MNDRKYIILIDEVPFGRNGREFAYRSVELASAARMNILLAMKMADGSTPQPKVWVEVLPKPGLVRVGVPAPHDPDTIDLLPAPEPIKLRGFEPAPNGWDTAGGMEHACGSIRPTAEAQLPLLPTPRRSPQVRMVDLANEHQYSDLQVLSTNAGWYIGTVHHNPEGFVEPGSRDSPYYATEAEAQRRLDADDWDQRLIP